MSLDLVLSQASDYWINYERKIEEAASFLHEKLTTKPAFGLVLGSGLHDLVHAMTDTKVIPYEQIPSFPQPTVKGHEGKLWIGNLEGVPVLGLQGRKHYYEVADQPFNTGILQVVFSVHVLANLGVRNYFVTNAAGGLLPSYHTGDIMVIQSHLSRIPNPLLGRDLQFTTLDGKPMERFVAMYAAYDPRLSALLLRAGLQHHKGTHQGIYMAMTGPTYETEAEVHELRRDNVRAVGMSTVPEVIVARARGMKAVGFSCITNVIAEDGTNATSHEEVQRVSDAPETRERLTSIIRQFFLLYGREGR